jgi:hypothetical protein
MDSYNYNVNDYQMNELRKMIKMNKLPYSNVYTKKHLFKSLVDAGVITGKVESWNMEETKKKKNK